MRPLTVSGALPFASSDARVCTRSTSTEYITSGKLPVSFCCSPLFGRFHSVICRACSDDAESPSMPTYAFASCACFML